MIRLLALPLEILLLIGSHLNSNDRLECCTVSKEFYENFRLLLYYSITFNNPHHVIIIANQMSIQRISLNSIHKLTINYSLPNQENYIIEFLQHCHNLEELVIGRSFWSNQLLFGYDGDITFGGFPKLNLLKHLTVECHDFVSVEDLYPLLSLCPNVKTIIFNQLLKTTLPKELERVHNIYCPKLEELCLDHEMAEEDILDGFVDFKNALTNISFIHPATTFKKMNIFHSGLWDDFVVLLKYMSFKYPSLEQLEISFHPSWQEVGIYNDLVEMEIFRNEIKTFMQKCNNVKIVKFNDVCWADMIFASQFRSRNYFDKVSLHSRIGVSLKVFNLLMISSYHHITELDITLSSVSFLNDKVKDFQHCSKLKKLKLSFIEDDMVLGINIIFDMCLQLQSLTLDNVTLDCKPTKRHHEVLLLPLHQKILKLTLTRCNFNNTLWLYLEEKCPNLTALDIRFCTHCQGISIILYFPKHYFTSISIHHLRILSPSVVIMDEMISGLMAASFNHYKRKTIEFITIRRFQSTHPDHFISRGPFTFVKPKARLTRSMIKAMDENGGHLKQLIQTIRVNECLYSLTEFGYSINISLAQQQLLPQIPIRILERCRRTIPGFDPKYVPLEYIQSTKFLKHREVKSFRMDGIDIPSESDLNQLGIIYESVCNGLYFVPPSPVLYARHPTILSTFISSSPSTSSSTSPSTLSSSSSSLLSQLSSPFTSSHSSFNNLTEKQQEGTRTNIIIDIYSTMELKINGKWIIF